MGCLCWINSNIYGEEGATEGERVKSLYVCFSGSLWVDGGLCVMIGIKITLL